MQLSKSDLQKDLCQTSPPRTVSASDPVPAAGHCWPTPLQETLKHSQAGLAQSFVGCNAPFPVSWCTQGFSLCPPRVSGGYGAWFKRDWTPPTILLWLLLCPWMGGIFFSWVPTSSCQRLFSGVLTGEDKCTFFYSAIFQTWYCTGNSTQYSVIT